MGIGIKFRPLLKWIEAVEDGRPRQFLGCRGVGIAIGDRRCGLVVVGQHVSEFVGFIVDRIAACDGRAIFVGANMASRSTTGME